MYRQKKLNYVKRFLPVASQKRNLKIICPKCHGGVVVLLQIGVAIYGGGEPWSKPVKVRMRKEHGMPERVAAFSGNRGTSNLMNGLDLQHH